MKTHLISVILPVYNAEEFLVEAINSILQQTFEDFEFIIIDDGSTDETTEIIHAYHDSRIKYLKNPQNQGIVKTLNNGLLHANGKYIARMDADDISYPTRLEIQYKYLEEHPNIGVIGTGIELFGDTIHDYRLFSNSSKKLKAELLFNSCIPHPTAMIRRSILVDNNLTYNENYYGREDFAPWSEISKYSDIGMINQVLHKYRLHEKQITAKQDEQKSINSRKFLEYRMSDIGYSFSNNEEDIFLQYCLGKYNKLTKQEIFVFINSLSNIKKLNKINNYFPKNELATVCSLSIFESIKHLSSKEQRDCFLYAIKRNLLSLCMVLKYVAHKIIS